MTVNEEAVVVNVLCKNTFKLPELNASTFTISALGDIMCRHRVLLRARLARTVLTLVVLIIGECLLTAASTT